MAGCNNQAVENVKSNIASQIVALQNEINDMQQTISRLENCNGTKENPHNHSSEIRSLDAQISANEELIRQLTELLIAVTEAEKTMEEADRRLRELVEEYQQGKTKRMKLTSAMLYDEMKILEEEHKAEMIDPHEYEGTLAHLKKQYIETLQFEIEMKKERLPSVSGNSSEYNRFQEEIKKNTENLISFVELNNMTYPKSLDEQKADELRKELGLKNLNDLPIVYNIAWYEQKAVIVLLALLSLGIKNIKLGPTLPAFLSPEIIKLLQKEYNLTTITTLQDDMQELAL